jgi:hypothetical protein
MLTWFERRRTATPAIRLSFDQQLRAAVRTSRNFWREALVACHRPKNRYSFVPQPESLRSRPFSKPHFSNPVRPGVNLSIIDPSFRS